jgi:hypothetical protein
MVRAVGEIEEELARRLFCVGLHGILQEGAFADELEVASHFLQPAVDLPFRQRLDQPPRELADVTCSEERLRERAEQHAAEESEVVARMDQFGGIRLSDEDVSIARKTGVAAGCKRYPRVKEDVEAVMAGQHSPPLGNHKPSAGL